MDDASEPAATLDAETLARCVEKVAEASSVDLTAALGRATELKAAGVEPITAAKVAVDDAPLVHQLCRATGGLDAEVHALIPRNEAGLLASLQMGDEEGTGSQDPLDMEKLTALQVVTKLIITSLETALCDDGFDTSIEVRDAREIPEPASDPTWLSGEHFHRLRFELAIERAAGGRIDLLLALNADAARAGAGGRTILFVVTREAEGESLEELSASLGSPVTITCPDALDSAPLEEAGAIVLPWSVGGRSGLELVEELTRRAGLAQAPIIMAAREPTRMMVMAALRAGASSFVHLPYDGDALKQRILAASREAPTPSPDERDEADAA